MAKFKLRDYKRKDKKKTIYLYFYYQNKKTPFKFNTGEYVLESNWDKSKERVKYTVTNKDALRINDYLNQIEAGIQSVYNPNIETNNFQLKKRLLDYLRFGSSEDIDFFTFAKKDNERLLPSTKKVWDSTVNIINNYQDHYGKVDFNSFDMVFYNQFKEYCMKILNYANSTFDVRIGHLKRILRNAENQGIEVNQGYKNSDFKKIGYSSETVYLSVDEINQLIDVDLNEELSQIRDAFVVRCYIGTRFSDSEINKNNIVKVNGVDLLKVYMQKTQKHAYIPIHPIVRKIMDENDWEIKSLTNQYTNRKIKEICKLAGINEKIIFSKKRGGISKTYTKEKWELITTHTARRSVATNMYLSDIEPSLILPITGHSTVKQLMVYIKADNLTKALMVAKSGFYKQYK